MTFPKTNKLPAVSTNDSAEYFTLTILGQGIYAQVTGHWSLAAGH